MTVPPSTVRHNSGFFEDVDNFFEDDKFDVVASDSKTPPKDNSCLDSFKAGWKNWRHNYLPNVRNGNRLKNALEKAWHAISSSKSIFSITNESATAARHSASVFKEIGTILKKIGEAFLNNPVGRLALKVSRVLLGIFANPHFLRVMQSIKLAVPIITIPYTIYWMYYKIKDLASGDPGLRIDSILGLLSDVGYIAETLALFTQGLAEMGAFAMAAVPWVLPLSIAGVMMQIVNIPRCLNSMWQTYQLKKKLNLDNINIENQEEIVELIQKLKDLDKRRWKISRLIGIDADRYLAAINRETTTPEKFKFHVEELKNRIKYKQIGDTLALVATAVSVLGFTLLLVAIAVPALAPVGYGFLALGALTMLTKLILDVRSHNRFEKSVCDLEDKVCLSTLQKVKKIMVIIKKYCGQLLNRVVDYTWNQRLRPLTLFFWNHLRVHFNAEPDIVPSS